MKFKWDKKYLYWGITAFLVIIASICFYYVLYNSSAFIDDLSSFISICMPIINGLIIAYLLAPIVNFLEKNIIRPILHRFKIEEKQTKTSRLIRATSIIITLLLLFFLIYIFILIVIPRLYESIESIIFLFPTYVNNFTTWITKILGHYPDLEEFTLDLLNNYSVHITDWLNETFLPGINEMIKTLSLSVLGFLKGTWNLILGLMISIYLLASKETFIAQFKKLMYAILNTENANFMLSDMRFINKTFGGFIGGKLLDSLLIGIICFVCTSFINIPYAVLISVIIGLTNIIPFFGPFLGAIPCSLLILMVDPIKCVYFIIFILILQQFDGNVLGPKILGDSTGLSGFWVIFSITLFGGVFGLVGMVIGVPLFAVAYAFVRRYVNVKLAKKGLPTEVDVFKVKKDF